MESSPCKFLEDIFTVKIKKKKKKVYYLQMSDGDVTGLAGSLMQIIPRIHAGWSLGLAGKEGRDYNCFHQSRISFQERQQRISLSPPDTAI